jgi:uncharacterized heparinase superfamily protein
MSRAAELFKAHLHRSSAWLRARVEKLVFSSRYYRMSLGGRAPMGLAAAPPARAGDAQRGAAILDSIWLLAGERLTIQEPFAVTSSEAMLAELHAFRWLADLRALGTDAGRAKCRALITAWIAHNGEWAPLPWRGDVLGRRVGVWLAEYGAIALDSDETFRELFFRSLTRQVHHLDRLARLGGNSLGPAGHGRLEALVAFVEAAACLPGWKDRLAKSLVLLLHEIGVQVLPDGGQCQRSPAVHRDVVHALVDARATLTAGRHVVPTALQTAIDRMTPMLRLFRHGDGGLALFNHTSEGDAAEIADLLTSSDAPGRPPPGAPHTGFQRLESGRAIAIMDTGSPAPAELGAYAHAGTLSFELSYGKDRVIVNCGARPHAKGKWLVAQRATAAHSTLVLANANSTEIFDSGRLGRRPRHVLCRREEADGAILVDTSHDGYEPPFGVLHRRRLYLAPEGEDLRGEDQLTRVRPGRDALPFVIRFHLHPDVRASLMHDGTAVLLRSLGGTGLRLDAGGGRLAIEESIYLGNDTGPRRSEQIVIESTLAGEEALVKWSLKRISGE